MTWHGLRFFGGDLYTNRAFRRDETARIPSLLAVLLDRGASLSEDEFLNLTNKGHFW